MLTSTVADGASLIAETSADLTVFEVQVAPDTISHALTVSSVAALPTKELYPAESPQPSLASFIYDWFFLSTLPTGVTVISENFPSLTVRDT